MTIEYLAIKFSPQEHKRIFSNIDYTKKGCWIWTRGKDYKGYGQGYYDGRRERIHRIVYAFFKGPIPRGENRKEFQLDHLCKNKACCNPNHLELVSARVNILRSNGITANNAKKTHCKHGHLLPPYNINHTNKRARAFCKICDSIRHKKLMKGPKREYWLKKAREAAKRYREKQR